MKTILQSSLFAVSFILSTFNSNSTAYSQIQVDADGVGADGIAHLTKVGNKMFYYGRNETNTSNLDLFMHDGTTSTFVKHLATYAQNPGINTTTIIHDGYGKAYFYFSSNGGAIPNGLVVSDGTAAGTQQIFTCKQPVWYANCNGKVFFNTKLGTISDNELYVSDGTAAGTFMVKDIYPGTTGSNPNSGVEFNNEFWFTALSSTQSGYQLYRSDGTATGTSQFVYPATLKGLVSDLYVHNGYLYFRGSTTASVKALWRTDGTTAGTVKIFEGTNAIGTFGIINSLGNTLLGFSTNMNVFPYIYSLYSIDAITLDTNLIKTDISIVSAQAGNGWMLNNKMVFLGKTSTAGNEPWITDGTSTGTFILSDLNAGTANTNIYRNVGYSNNELYLNTQSNGILKTDGTAVGTATIGVHNDNNFFNSFLSLNNEVYFVMDSPGRQMKLFKLGSLATSIWSDVMEQGKVFVYPNPSTGIFHISNQNNQTIAVSIYSITGEKVYENKFIDNSPAIDLSNHTKGLYFVNIDNGNGVVSKKLIIQ